MTSAAALDVNVVFGGWPFLDEGFRPQTLLAAVSAARTWRSRRADLETITAKRDVLSPTVGREIIGRDLPGEAIDHRGLRGPEQEAVGRELSDLRQENATFAVLFALPTNFAVLRHAGVISCSAIHYPQHVFLSEVVFRSRPELTEQIIHEYIHIWMYMIEELIPLSHPGPQGSYQLPSGTSGKSSQEVLGAAHVSAALCRYYTGSVRGCNTARAAVLLDYLKGCEQIMRGLDGLSAAGDALRSRLFQEVEALETFAGGMKAA